MRPKSIHAINSYDNRQDAPREGTLIRRVWDALHTNMAIYTRDFRDMKGPLSTRIDYLRDFYGLQIEKIKGGYALA